MYTWKECTKFMFTERARSKRWFGWWRRRVWNKWNGATACPVVYDATCLVLYILSLYRMYIFTRTDWAAPSVPPPLLRHKLVHSFRNRQICPFQWYVVSTHKVSCHTRPPALPRPTHAFFDQTRPPRHSKLRPPLTGYSTYRIHLINWWISFHSCQVLSPSETGLVVSAHRLPNITLLTM